MMKPIPSSKMMTISRMPMATPMTLPPVTRADRTCSFGAPQESVKPPGFRRGSVGLKHALLRLAAMALHGGTTMTTDPLQLADSRRVFDLFDLNGDGFIDQDEFHVLLVRLDGDVSREECELDFEVADTTGDGYIEFREFVAWWTN